MPKGAIRTLEDILVERGFLTPEVLPRLRSQAAEAGKTVEQLIYEQKIVPEEQLVRAKSALLNIPYVSLEGREIPLEILNLIPLEAARMYQMVAFEREGRTLKVAMVQPDNFQALEALKFIAKKEQLQPEIYITSATNLARALAKQAGGLKGEVTSAIEEFRAAMEEEGKKKKRTREVEKVVEKAPVTKAVAVILRHAIEGRASDIHIEPEERDLRVRFRVDGVLYTSLVLSMDVHPAIVSRIKILANLRIDEQRLPQDGRFSTTAEGHAYDFRVSVLPTAYGEKVVMRILDKSKGALPFEELGITGARKKAYEEAIHRPHGLVLITGPTGSGKSTTLFTCIDVINDPRVNISTLEDPIEYHIPGVNQTQVNADIGLTFASGLRALLRQDPDIIMVGEIRDKETANLAIHASLTGHLVLSTLHTNDAVGAIPRLIDMGLEPFLLAAVLRLATAQRLVQRICPDCKEEIPMPPEIRRRVEEELGGLPERERTHPNQRSLKVLYRGKGCRKCGRRGMRGRLAITETVPVDEKIREAITQQKDHDTLMALSRAAGNITMRQDGILKALAGWTTIEEVMRVTAED